MAIAGSAGAAVPLADATHQAIPLEYTAGHAAGFRGTFHLTDTSTLSKLYLRINLVNDLGTNVYYRVTRNGNDIPAKDCSLDGQDVVCSFKTVRSSDFIVAIAAYTPAAGQGQVSVEYIWNSTGIPQNDDNSHGDSWDGVAVSATESAGGNYAGGFALLGDRSIGNAGIGVGNAQSAKLVNLPIGYAATVLDGPLVGINCQSNADVDCTKLIGEAVEVNVADGQIVDVFQVQITYGSGIPTPKGFVHVYGDPANPTQELIGACAKKSPTPPCFTWDPKTNTATILTTHNGSFKGR